MTMVRLWAVLAIGWVTARLAVALLVEGTLTSPHAFLAQAALVPLVQVAVIGVVRALRRTWAR